MGENINNASKDRKEILFKEKKLILLLILLPPTPRAISLFPLGELNFFFLNCLT